MTKFWYHVCILDMSMGTPWLITNRVNYNIACALTVKILLFSGMQFWLIFYTLDLITWLRRSFNWCWAYKCVVWARFVYDVPAHIYTIFKIIPISILAIITCNISSYIMKILFIVQYNAWYIVIIKKILLCFVAINAMNSLSMIHWLLLWTVFAQGCSGLVQHRELIIPINMIS